VDRRDALSYNLSSMNWSQLQTVLWLRWRLSKNQWSRAGRFNAALSAIALVFGVLIGLGGGIAGTLAGATILAAVPPQRLMLVWDAVVGAFLFFWLIGLLSELQRSETIDLRRLLHLPVSLRWIFVVSCSIPDAVEPFLSSCLCSLC